MFDFTKVGNTLNEIKDFLDRQSKQKDLELLVNTTATLCGDFSQGESSELASYVQSRLSVAQMIIAKARTTL